VKPNPRGSPDVAELRVHLALERASGVLAGIVASLAQKKLELKTQKLTRAAEGRGGSLDIHAEGEPGDIAALAEHLAKARGVGEVVRIEVDGMIVFFDGAVVTAPEDDNNPFTLDDDVAEAVDSELDAFLEPEPTTASEPPPQPIESDDFLEPDEVPSAAIAARENRPAPDPAGDHDLDDDDDLGPLLRPIEQYPDESNDVSPDDASERRPSEPPAEPDPAPDDASTGWGDEELDGWADDVEALDRPEPGSEVGIEPLPAESGESNDAIESGTTPDAPPESDDDAARQDRAERDRADDPAASPGGTDRAGGTDRTGATLRRRRRRRR
jgi:hypothetical protein